MVLILSHIVFEDRLANDTVFEPCFEFCEMSRGVFAQA